MADGEDEMSKSEIGDLLLGVLVKAGKIPQELYDRLVEARKVTEGIMEEIKVAIGDFRFIQGHLRGGLERI